MLTSETISKLCNAAVAVLDSDAGIASMGELAEAVKEAGLGDFTAEHPRQFSYDKIDGEFDAPCNAGGCGKGPLNLKGYGVVCPDGHITDEFSYNS